MLLSPSEPRGSMGILRVLVKDTRANQSRGRIGGGVNLLEAWSTHGLHHCFFLGLALVRSAPKISQIDQYNISHKKIKYSVYFKAKIFPCFKSCSLR